MVESTLEDKLKLQPRIIHIKEVQQGYKYKVNITKNMSIFAAIVLYLKLSILLGSK